MTSPLVEKAKALALATLVKHGRAATLTWPGAGASLIEDATDATTRVTIFLGKRATQVLGNSVVTTIDAVMSPVGRNPVGAQVKAGASTYTILSSDDLGEAPDGIAAHRLVVR